MQVSSFQVVARSPEIKSKWDDLVRGSPDGWAWGLYDWQDVVLGYERLGVEDRSFALMSKTGPLAVVPLHFIRAEARLALSGFGLVGPILAADLPEKSRRKVLRAIFDSVFDIARRDKCTTIEVGSSPVCKSSLKNNWGVNPFVEFGFQDVSQITRVIDLRKDDKELFRGLSEDARQNIRRAEVNGYEVSLMPWPEMLSEYYRIHCDTYKRTGAMPHERKYFEGISEKMSANGVAQLWTAFDKTGRVVGFHNDARFGHASYYHTGCSEPICLEHGVNYLLFWRAILGAKESGCDWYDVGNVFPGAQSGKEKGLTTFKSKFGGEAHRHFLGRMEVAFEKVAPSVKNQIDTKLAFNNWTRSTKELIEATLGLTVAGNLTVIVRNLRGLFKSLRELGSK